MKSPSIGKLILAQGTPTVVSFTLDSLTYLALVGDSMENDNAELEALRSEAIDYCNQGDFDKAITIHKDILNRYSDNDQACTYSYASIGDIYLTLRELELAEDYLRKALGYDPLKPKFHYLLGFTYSVSRQWDRAIKEFELSVKQEPEDAEYLRGLGWALWSTGKRPRA